jgi:hypothetical protein
MGEVVAAMRGTFDETFDTTFGADAPYYMFGHRLEISNLLLNKDISRSTKYKKYPLVALRMDFEEKFDKGIYSVSLNIALIASTKPDYTAEQRYEHVFRPTLYQMYDNFMTALHDSDFFYYPDAMYPKHTKIDRPFWGTPTLEKNEKYIFNDPLDAIEIINLELKFNGNC